MKTEKEKKEEKVMEFTPKNRATVQNMPKLPYAVEEALNRLRVNVSFLGGMDTPQQGAEG